MKKILAVIVLISQVLIGCGGTYRITRSGYDITEKEQKKCSVKITKILKEGIKTSKLGSIQLSDKNTMTENCTANSAYSILKDEACKIDANLIIITDEKNPDLLSSCYRCSADFYFADTNMLNQIYNNKDFIAQEDIVKLTKKGNGNNAVSYVLGTVAGFALGYFVIGPLLFGKK